MCATPHVFVSVCLRVLDNRPVVYGAPAAAWSDGSGG